MPEIDEFEDLAERMTTIWIDGVKCETYPHKKDLIVALRNVHNKAVHKCLKICSHRLSIEEYDAIRRLKKG